MPSPRLESIDSFRGFAILGMVLANYLAGVALIPAWLKHAPDVGLTVIDLIAPFFIFAIGLTYGLSARRRAARDGWAKTAGHIAARFLAIIGIGAIISAGETALGENLSGIDWGVLQAIGSAGLATLLVIRLPAGVRAALGLLLLAAYQWMLDRYWLATVLRSPHGGLHGALGWSAMLILATVLADLFHSERRRWYTWVSSLALLAGMGLALLIPISKNRVSAPYVLVSLGASALLFGLFAWLVDNRRRQFPLLASWGKNPLLLYVLHYLLLGLVVLPGIPGWYAAAPGWLVILQALALVGTLSAIAWGLARRGWIVSL